MLPSNMNNHSNWVKSEIIYIVIFLVMFVCWIFESCIIRYHPQWVKSDIIFRDSDDFISVVFVGWMFESCIIRYHSQWVKIEIISRANDFGLVVFVSSYFEFWESIEIRFCWYYRPSLLENVCQPSDRIVCIREMMDW